MKNFILQTDSYKTSHFLQYPEGTTKVSSYIEARGGDSATVCFFGLQIFLKQLADVVITEDDVLQAEHIITAHGLPFNSEGWMIIVNDHGGKIPVIIEALPEGSVVPVGTALVQLQNTDSRLPWLTSYLETALLRAVWYPTTVATISRKAKTLIREYLDKTSDNPAAEILFKLHDFGARGVSSKESAEIGGLAHLVNFRGSDTLEAIAAAQEYYYEPMAGFSIPAAEHSTITSWGRANEVNAYHNMIEQFGGDGKLYAVVSDSYDIYNACEQLWGQDLRQEVITKGGTLVIRPDSGDPVEVTLKVIQILEEKFGTTLNSKGYKVLPPYIRIIQGDGVNLDSIERILKTYEAYGYSASNITFGMGGALLQKVDRDTFKFAMKASYIEINGRGHDVYKDPITDTGKRSKRGLLGVARDEKGNIFTGPSTVVRNMMEIVYHNGDLLSYMTLEDVRKNSEVNYEFN
jgi:nicotinamide phosphoribosyltransferase